MEKSTGTAWTDLEWSQRSLHLRECALKRFWQILVDDKPFYRDGFDGQVVEKATAREHRSKSIRGKGGTQWKGKGKGKKDQRHNEFRELPEEQWSSGSWNQWSEQPSIHRRREPTQCAPIRLDVELLVVLSLLTREQVPRRGEKS